MSCALQCLSAKKAASVFGRLQRFLDRMNVVMRENITGVRVIRAFNKETYEAKRMKKSFEDYARAAVETNLLFAGLDSFSFFGHQYSGSGDSVVWRQPDRAGTMESEILRR